MPCGDCSIDDLCRCGTGEVCGHCFEAARAMGRVLILPEEPEPTKGDFLRCRCTHYQMNHRPFTKGGCRNCACDCFRLSGEGHDFVTPEHCDGCAKAWRVQLAGGPMVQRPLAPEAPKPCQHPNKQYTGALYDGPGGRKSYVYYSCPDCKAHWKEEERKPCTCGPDEACGDCPNPPGAHDFVSPAHCGACMASWTDGAKPVEDEAPLTPEEEEEVPEDRCTCGETACESESCDCDSVPCPVDHAEEAEALDARWAKAMGDDDPPPPQPNRRPPYAVAYSVSGHLYEVALPGDAAVQAIDGALIITHRLGPVAGICQIAPIVNEESNGQQ